MDEGYCAGHPLGFSGEPDWPNGVYENECTSGKSLLGSSVISQTYHQKDDFVSSVIGLLEADSSLSEIRVTGDSELAGRDGATESYVFVAKAEIDGGCTKYTGRDFLSFDHGDKDMLNDLRDHVTKSLGDLSNEIQTRYGSALSVNVESDCLIIQRHS